MTAALPALATLSAYLLTLMPASEPAPPPERIATGPVDDAITVTASGLETPLGETPAAVTTVGDDELDASGALTLDDTLRRVPGFTLFRRSGSRAANPTTQGASLRGIGGSAASRALVLADGIPVNDPFGGWVAWGRVPRAALERVEVLRGGASDLYGSAALAGVVHLVRRSPSERTVEVAAATGEQDTGTLSAWVSSGRGDRSPWAFAVAADALATDGYVPVAPDERGAVDAPAGVDHLAVEATAAWEADPAESAPAGADRAFLRASWLDEERTNGTEVQANDTRIARLTLGADGRAAGGSYSLRLWGGDQDFHQVFSAVADDRDSERTVREQDVPSEEAGLTVRHVRGIGREGAPSHTVVGGLDLRRVEGVSGETVFLPSGELSLEAGGEQLLGGAYVEDLVRLSGRLSAQLALRYDRWWNRSGFRSFEGSETRIPNRSEAAWSPRLALHYRAAESWSLTGSAYRSFRAPTLNELYRGFRVGDVVTDPNEDLRAERLTGAELGAIWTPRTRILGDRPGTWRLRGTLFRMELEDPIANVTLEVTPELILRQRRNLGRIRSRGVELEASGRIGPALTVDAAYLWTDSEVTDFPADPTLEGRRTPQVPEHRASVRLGWAAPFDLSVHLQARWADTAFDDDRNRFPLGSLTVVDLRIARRVGRRFEIFVAAENLLDDEHVVGRTPVTTLGSPRLARVGLRIRPGRASR
ncbi:MAG: TonB-dependent receptor [Acidobacteriota bacterium]|jgi:outer membrane receptor protein involved in Fe transport